MSKIVLEVKGLNFNYEKKNILKDINFEIKKGEYVAIIGENGSGKSTLLNIILGNLSPMSGEIKLYENEIGYLSQQVRNFNKKFPATVEEIIAANLYSQMGLIKILKKQHKMKIEESLKIVNMESYKKRLIGNLSGGQQQRVFLARLLVNNPKIIFMDEPIVGLDDESIDVFYNLMDKLNSELKLTIVMVTHDIKTTKMKADKIISIEQSKMKIIEQNESCQKQTLQKQMGEFKKVKR